MKWLDGITDAMDMNLGKLLEMVRNREAWRAAIHGVTIRHDWATEQLQQPVSVLGHLGMAPYLSHTESSPVCMHMHTGHVSKCSFLLPLFTGVTFSSTPCSLISNFSWRMGQLLKSESTQTTFQQQPGSQ